MDYTFKFHFHDWNEAADLETLNRVLGAMKLTSCDLKEMRCYYCEITEFEPESAGKKIKAFRYGLCIDSGELTCSDWGKEEKKTCFQIGTAAFSITENVHSDQFAESWKKDHPDKRIRSLSEWEFDDCTGFVVIYHDPINDRTSIKEIR